MIDETIEELKKVKQTLEELQREYEMLLEHKQIADKTIDMYAKKCKVLEKALELACERVKYFEEMQDKEMGVFELFGYDSDYDLQTIIKEYKEQASKELGK